MQPDVIDTAKFSLTAVTSIHVAMDLSFPLEPFSTTVVGEGGSNDDIATTDSMAINDNYTGSLCCGEPPVDDVDVVKFTGTEGTTISIVLDLGTLELGLLSLLDADGTLLLNSFGSNTELPEIIFTLPAGGFYFLKIEMQPFPFCGLSCCTGGSVGGGGRAVSSRRGGGAG